MISVSARASSGLGSSTYVTWRIDFRRAATSVASGGPAAAASWTSWTYRLGE